MPETNGTTLPFRVIEGTAVDLISPFPNSELDRLFGWLRRIRTEFGGDDSPKSRKETLAFYANGLKAPNITSWGIVDKGNITEGKIETPLVGFIAFERHSKHNGYLHIALTKKANDEKLIDESIELAVQWLFTESPNLLRVSAIAAQSNWLVAEIADRVGFRREGVCEDFYTNRGEPRNVVHYGLTRRRFEELCRSWQHSDQYSQESEGDQLSQEVLPLGPQLPDQSLEPLAKVENREARPVPGLPLPIKT